MPRLKAMPLMWVKNYKFWITLLIFIKTWKTISIMVTFTELLQPKEVS